MDSDSPTIGDGTANNADDAWVAGRFGTVATPADVTLAIGETLTVSGSLILTGGLGVDSNLRFGVFDESGQFASGGTTWSNGGWLLRAGANPDDGWHKARTNGAFVSTNPNAAIITPRTNTNTGGALDGDSTIAYDWSISVTRDSATTVDLFGSIAGGDNAYNQTYTANDIATSLFTYNAVGLLFGASLDVDQAVLSGVQYTVVPSGPPSEEPKITSFSIAGTSATVVMMGAPGTDYYCAGSGDLTDWTTEVVPTDTPGSPFQTNASGDLTFTVDISSFGSSYFFRVQDTDPNP